MTDTILRIATRVHRLAHSQLRGPRGPRGPAGPAGPAGPTGGDLSDTPPAPLGTVAPGVSTEASRADHVHPAPKAVQISDSTMTGRAVLTAADPKSARDAIGTLWGTIDPAAGNEMVLGDETIDLSNVTSRGSGASLIVGRNITVDPRVSTAGTAQVRGNVIVGAAIQMDHSSNNTLIGAEITAHQTNPDLASNPNVGSMTLVGFRALGTSIASVAIGYNSASHGLASTALGAFALAKPMFTAPWPPSARSARGATAVGYSVQATHDCAVAIGAWIRATHPRSIAIGGEASPGHPASHTTAADSTVILTNRIEMIPHALTEAGAATFVILRSPDGARWSVGVDNSGALTVAAAPT